MDCVWLRRLWWSSYSIHIGCFLSPLTPRLAVCQSYVTLAAAYINYSWAYIFSWIVQLIFECIWINRLLLCAHALHCYTCDTFANVHSSWKVFLRCYVSIDCVQIIGWASRRMFRLEQNPMQALCCRFHSVTFGDIGYDLHRLQANGLVKWN